MCYLLFWPKPTIFLNLLFHPPFFFTTDDFCFHNCSCPQSSGLLALADPYIPRKVTTRL